MSKPQIILASQSIGRRGLLEKLGLTFTIRPMDVPEEQILHKDPIKVIKMRASAKADKIAKELKTEKGSFLVICADSEAVLEGKTYGKSPTKEEGKRILHALMGKTHTFVTATNILLIEEGKLKKRWQSISKTLVTLRKMSDEEVEEYLTRYDFSRFAAAYTFNETPWNLITKIDGSYTNVIGLPFEVLLPILRELGYFS